MNQDAKPGFDVYSMMLVISLIAVIIACILLWLELRSYGPFPWWNAR